MVDADVVRRFRDGDPEAVRALYREYGRLVYAVALRRLGSTALAEEATQLTFTKAWQAAATLDVERDLAPWFATIAQRAAIDVHRREAVRAAVPLEEVREEPQAPGADETAERRWEGWQVRQAVDELPADEREVVRLQHLAGLSQSEVADRLGLPLGTVKSRSFRAHRRLAARLGFLRDGGGGDDG